MTGAPWPVPDLERRLAALPRHRLIPAATPIQVLPRLSDALGVQILVKRDDLTALAFGGNKVRQAEFFVGAALDARADVIIAGGSYAQSNHARVCAAAATAAGLHSVILVRPGDGPTADDATGNALVTRLVAGEMRVVRALAEVPRGDRLGEIARRRDVFEGVAAELSAEGRNPYVLLGSSTALGVMGYVAASLELAAQRHALGLEFSKVFVTSLGATHAGLALGASLMDAPYDVVGVGYQPATDEVAASWVRRLMDDAAALLGVAAARERVVSDARHGGPEYGLASAASSEALALAAHSDALLLDPVYTAKGFAGLLAWIREGRIAPGETVLFIHTGGLPALFAY